ncbi:MAG: RNA methyltransferase [Proteobacteria bacterium]|nr:TrmH family RNA methyltransferase [Pseudomonadota bacterium]NOG60510.1 RNA methyltransferase [Pseudomonadota bacterium]
MNTEQRSNLISRLSDIINDDRVERLQEVLNQRTRYLTIVLDDIYQPQNSSAIMRTSECIGIQTINIIEDRNEHKTNRDVVKGSSKWIDLNLYECEDGRIECIKNLKQQNYKIAAMTLNQESIPLEELPVNEKLALCFGSEDTGLHRAQEHKADYKVQIPITGFTQSYNVSVSAGISLYYLINKIKETNQNWQLTKDEKEKLLIEWLSKSTPTGRILLDKYKTESE